MADTIHADKLCALTGLTDRRHRQLAKAGYFPPPVKSEYQLAPTIKGMFQYYREQNARKDTTYDKAKTREKQAKAQIAELEAKEREGKLLELSLVQQTCGNICTAFTNRLANFGDGLASICHQQPGEFVAQRINEGLRSALRELSKMPYVPSEKE